MATIGALIITAALVSLASAAPSRVKTQHTELRDEYDFVIAGGGTAGLTVADRLTEAFPDSKSSFHFWWIKPLTALQAMSS